MLEELSNLMYKKTVVLTSNILRAVSRVVSEDLLYACIINHHRTLLLDLNVYFARPPSGYTYTVTMMNDSENVYSTLIVDNLQVL